MDAVCQLYEADCLEVLAGMPADSIDAVVTDPPYHLTTTKRFGATSIDDDNVTGHNARKRATPQARLSGGFMGKVWDGGGIAFDPDTWRAVYRVLKPGAHMLVFGGTRTSHRMVCAIEDAGFEIRDTLMWVYGTGFPKSLDVSKAINRMAGAEREVVGRYQPPNGTTWNLEHDVTRSNVGATGHSNRAASLAITAPATPEAAQWAGWGTALKPAFEPIVLCRRPLSEKTVAANVLRHGTGAINVDACRIPTTQAERDFMVATSHPNGTKAGNAGGVVQFGDRPGGFTPSLAGRWPANVIHDGSDEVEAAFAAFGERRKSDGHTIHSATSLGSSGSGIYGKSNAFVGSSYVDSGTASRFFYSSKVSKADRADSKHPTVKPLALMRYLCKLITPPGGTVLDPFAGSGTTGEAALDEGFSVTLIEREAEYCRDIRRRLK